MIAGDSLKEKVIIVAEHDESSGQYIFNALKNNGFDDVRCVNDGEKIYEVLRLFYDQPEKIGLIVISENLPHCQLIDIYQNLSGTSDDTAIPFLILCNDILSEESSNIKKSHSVNNDWFTHKLVYPVNPQELLLVVNFLLKLRIERLFHNTQKEQLIHELSEQNVNNANLKYLLAHDELTGLLNRSYFERQLKLALYRINIFQRNAVLLLIEVDRFSLINEGKGYHAGDCLLVELAIEMRKLAPSNSLFARVGVNEFCLFLEDYTEVKAQLFAENFKTAIENHKFSFDEVDQHVTLSIGISVLADVMPTGHPGQMVLHARQASRFGRSGPQNKIGVYSAQNIAIKEHHSDIRWTPVIKKALREDQLFLVFQPVVELNNGVISHYEVLLRMRHEKEIILPDVFIPVAERTGLMQSLDLWVIENAIDFLATLPSHRSYVSVSVKLSASAYQYPDLIDIIRDKLELTWVDASRLIFEIAETAVLENFQSTLDMVNKIRSLGCKCAIKHGSTGFYSLDYANTFPVEYIKINGQFTKHSANEESNKILLKSMVDMVAKLGKKIIFVYVESPHTVQKLREIGVPLAQGYTLGKPECNLLEEASIPFSQYISERHSAEKALREKESYLRVLIDNIPFLVWLKDANSRFLTVNQLLAEQLGLSSPEAIVGKTDFDFYPPDKARRYQADDREVLASRQRKTVEEASNSHLGVRRWTETFLAPILDDSGESLGTLGFARDITERKNIEADLRIAATAFESQEGMIVTDAETVVLKVNHSFTRITGYSAEETVGGKMNLLQSDIQDAAFYAEMWEQIRRTGNWQGEICNKRKNSEIYTAWLSITAVKVEEGVVTHYVGTMIDITARKAIEEQMRHIAHHDVLTDLPNRILLADRLHQALAHAKRDTTKLALLYIDLDKFKPVNDNFGHDVGDLLLKEVASRISACIRRESDTVSRLGGDEFVILLPNYDKEANVAMLAQKVLDSLSEPFFIEQNLINISSSIGIATFPAHGDDAGSLMKNADSAMYQAKHAGRSCLKFFG